MRKIFSILLILSPLLLFPQSKVADFFNNRIDFVLDNNYGRAFMGGIVKEYIIDDSLSVNNSYNKIGIQPFYKYSQSGFFDKNLLVGNKGVFANMEKTEFRYSGHVDSKTYNDFTLNINSLGDFAIKSVFEYKSGIKVRTSYYEPFKNFELSFYTKKDNVNGIVSKNLYSNASIKVINGISPFEKESISEMGFYNTLTIKLNNSDEHISFLITIYETIGMDDHEGPSHYFGLHPNIIMRKVEITGDKEKAIKYLKKNKLDYTEIAPEDYNEEYFKKKDN